MKDELKELLLEEARNLMMDDDEIGEFNSIKGKLA